MKSDAFEGLPAGTSFYVMIFMGVFMMAFAIIYILYLKNLYDLLKRVQEPNRRMAPARVWLMLISFLGFLILVPQMAGAEISLVTVRVMTIFQYAVSIFSLTWNFYMVNKIAESVAAELISRNREEPVKPTYAVGMFMCACNTLGLVAGIPYLAGLALMAAGAGLVAWIMYWYKTNEYKNKLSAPDLGDHF